MMSWYSIIRLVWEAESFGCCSANSASPTASLLRGWRTEELQQSIECVVLQNGHQLLYLALHVPASELEAVDVQIRYHACNTSGSHAHWNDCCLGILRAQPKKYPNTKITISELREYFCTKFRPFVKNTTVQKCAALCCIYLTYAKLTETQTSGTNFTIEQAVPKADFITRDSCTSRYCRERVLAMGILSVRLSVCLSRPGTDSSPGEIETKGLHHMIA